MMQISFIHILKVIFVLSTIVAVTDCCSSRILLLREHTLKIVQHQHDYHMHEHAHELQQKIEETAVQMLNQLELQRHQLEASAQDAAEELRQDADTDRETDPNPDPDNEKLYAKPVEEATEAGNLAQEADIFGSSTATWLTQRGSDPPAFSSSSSSLETVTMSTTIATDTGDTPPIDQSSSNPLDSSTPRPEDKGTNRTNETEVQMLPCSEEYNASFCLNGGHCFRHPMVNNTVFHSCICVNDYDGERCAYKSWNGDYVYTPPPLHRKVRMAQIVFSFPVLIMLSSLYVFFAAVFMLRNVPDYNRRKQQQLQHLHNQRFFVRC
ncbi:protein gurken [Drosophila serrata]|uniref:protein gurken n=1 Tax=Drosophila serrata TaxID=7274 RepID=UPI000A1D0EDC|nr:protein gurken [Drosophila serrata]